MSINSSIARSVCLSFVLTLAAAWAALAAEPSGTDPATTPGGKRHPPVAAYRVSGPYTHQNLAVFVLHSDRRDDRDFLTLDEGLRRGLIKVTEKQDAEVRELLIENRSDKPCYIQEGDRLKGGKQDRTIYASIVIKPRSGAVALPSFCIEQSRWRKGQSGDQFQATGNAALSPKSVRLAAKVGKDQSKVWKEVAKTKMAYAQALQAANKTSSLNEALDSPELTKAAAAFQAKLESIHARHGDAVGVAFAVNGKIEEISIYPGNPLLRKVYPRLLQSYAMEAAAGVKRTKPDAAGTKPL
ncbi:MAG: hypothetical protein OER86_09435, partial [Phycisphaerae bacterium]|nr:hypothetical protein [Phycisphaerae bacterium]